MNELLAPTLRSGKQRRLNIVEGGAVPMPSFLERFKQAEHPSWPPAFHNNADWAELIVTAKVTKDTASQ
ncbi:hypothetical protein ACW5EG_16970 [Luteimonas sp. A611]